MTTRPDTHRTGPGSLSDLADFHRPFRVNADGTVSDAPAGTPYAEPVYLYPDDDYADPPAPDPWAYFSTGYTRQHGYSGPTMHPSEQMAGALARDILDSPGVYVCVTVEALPAPADYPPGTDLSDEETDPAGWAVLYIPAP